MIPSRQAASRAIVLLAVLAPAASAQELTLSEAISSALASHPSLLAAQARLSGREEEVAAARAQRLPTLAAEANLTRFQEPMIVAPLHAFDPSRPPSFEETLLQGRLSATWTLLDWGERGGRIQAGEASAEMAELGAESAEAELLERVVASYLEVLTSRTVRDAADAQVVALESELDRVERNRAAGTAADVEVLRAAAALGDARAQAAVSAERAGLAERDLARVSGLAARRVGASELTAVTPRQATLEAGPAVVAPPDVAPPEVAPPGVAPPEVAPPVGPQTTGADTASGSGSPDVERARRGVSFAEARVGEWAATRLPRVDASAGLLDYGSLDGAHTAEWQAGLRLSWPIFTGGARAARVRAARADVEAARADLALAEMTVERRVDVARTAVAEAAMRAEALEASVEQWAEVARIEQLALDTGSGVQGDLLQAQAGLFQATAGLARARHDGVLALVRLAAALGSLDRTWIERALEGR